MEIDITEFKARLEKEIAKGNPDLAAFIHREIRLSEKMKASLMEEINEKTEIFLTAAAAKFDTYIFQLQNLEKELGLRNLSLDQKTALNDEMVREKIAEETQKLEKLKPRAKRRSRK